MDLLSTLHDDEGSRPLADVLRPATLSQIIGQDNLLHGPLKNWKNFDRRPSILLWGPPGCGKTSLAHVLAKESNLIYREMSAVSSGVADLKKLFAEAKSFKEQGKGCLLFLDEIHRFHKGQQDALLASIEKGLIVLIGATTENPSFALNNALLSRCQVLILSALNNQDLFKLFVRAEAYYKKALPLAEAEKQQLIAMAEGDARKLLTFVQSIMTHSNNDEVWSKEMLEKHLPAQPTYHDKNMDNHYDLLSALHKSMRASDCDASIYWLSRMLTAGEDPRVPIRRILRFAYEDIGLADTKAAEIALTAWQTYERLGSPEGNLAITMACAYCAMAPKSNAIYVAEKEAVLSASNSSNLSPPLEILNAPTKLMKSMGRGEGYEYDHNFDEGVSGFNCFPKQLARANFYRPKDIGDEKNLKNRLTALDDIRNNKK